MVTRAGQRPRPGAVSRCPARSGYWPGTAASALAGVLTGQRARHRQTPSRALLRPSHATAKSLRKGERRAAEWSSPVFSTNACGESAGKRKCSHCPHSSTQPVAADRRKRRNGSPDRFTESAARDSAADDPPGPRPACLRSLRLPGQEHRELCRSLCIKLCQCQGGKVATRYRRRVCLIPLRTWRRGIPLPQPRNRVPAPAWPCTNFAAAHQHIVFIGPEVTTLSMACER